MSRSWLLHEKDGSLEAPRRGLRTTRANVLLGLSVLCCGFYYYAFCGSRDPLDRLSDLWRADLPALLNDELVTWSANYHAPFREEQTLLSSKRIWQVAKQFDMTEQQASWRRQNPGWRHEVLTDEGMSTFVDSVFEAAPLLRSLYHSLPHIVMQADLFRLLVIYAEGGIYSDLDTTCLKPIPDWQIDAAELRNASLELVLGIELDVLDWSDEALQQWRFPGRFGFVQWTLWGQRGAAVLREAIVLTAQRFVEFAKAKGIEANEIYRAESLARNANLTPDELDYALDAAIRSLDFRDMDILLLTGPRLLTDAVMQHLSKDTEGGFNVTKYSKLQKPVIAGSLLILPVTFFSPGIPHSGSKPLDDPQAAVRHECVSLFFLVVVSPTKTMQVPRIVEE